MRYFTDEKIAQMKEDIQKFYGNDKDSALYMAYVTKLEILDKRYDQYGDCKEELLQTISELNRFAGQSVKHRGKVDVNDEDADAFEYENFDYSQTTD